MNRAEESARIRNASDRLYGEMGFSVIPCHHAEEPPPQWLVDRGEWTDEMVGKRPVVGWKKYQEVTPSAEDVSKWFRGSSLHNIAIVTGPISRIVVVDLDNAEALEWADLKLPETPLRVTTSRGEHRYYAWDSEHPMGNTAGLKEPTPDGKVRELAVDVRGDGGYVLAPGSRHKTGFLYATKPNATAWTAATLKTLPKLPYELFIPIVVPIDPPAIDPTLRIVPKEEKGYRETVKLERRLLAYVASVDGQGKGERNSAAYRLSANLLCDFAAPENVAWDLVQEWNTRNEPPLPERELRSTFMSAQRGGKHARGWKRDLDPHKPLRLVKGAATETQASTDGNLALDPSAEEAPEQSLLPMIDWNKIPEGSGWEFILEPAIPRGAVTILSGDGGLGKSLLACRIAVNVASGYDLLGRALPQSFRSTVFFMEDSLSEVKRRLGDMGYEGDGSINIFDNREVSLSLSKKHINAIRIAAQDHGSHLVIIDPLVSAAASANIDMNDPIESRAVVDYLAAVVAKPLNLSVLLIHHHNGSGRIQGGKAWSNAVRSHLAVYRHPFDRSKCLLIHPKDNCGEMPSLAYKQRLALPGVRSSVVVDIFDDEPGWTIEKLTEYNTPGAHTDRGSVDEAVKFLKLQLLPGARKEKKGLMDLAMSHGIRASDMNAAANLMSLRREFVPQSYGSPDMLCWELPTKDEEPS